MLGRWKYLVTRRAGSWSSGSWTTGTASTFYVTGSAQVLTAREVELLPEAARTSARLVLYVDSVHPDLKTTDVGGNTAADRVTIGGRDYLVLSEADWGAHLSGLRHRAYALAEVGDDE